MTAPTPAFLSHALASDSRHKLGAPGLLTPSMLKSLGDLVGLEFEPQSLTPATQFGQLWDTVLGKLSDIVKDIFSLSYKETTEKTPPAWVTYGGILCGLVLSYLDHLPSQIQRDLATIKTAHTRLLRQVTLVESKKSGQHLLPILDGLYSASQLHAAELLGASEALKVDTVGFRPSQNEHILGIYKSILIELGVLENAFLATKETRKNKSVLTDISLSISDLTKEIKRLIMKSSIPNQGRMTHSGGPSVTHPAIGPGEGGEVSWSTPDPLSTFQDDRTARYMISTSWALITSIKLSATVTQMTECIRTLTTYHDLLGRCVAQLLQQYQYIWFENSGFADPKTKESAEHHYTEQLMNDRSLMEALQSANVKPALSSSIMTTEVLNHTLQSLQDSFKTYLATAHETLDSDRISDDLTKIQEVLAQTPHGFSSSWIELAWKDLEQINVTMSSLRDCLTLLGTMSDANPSS